MFEKDLIDMLLGNPMTVSQIALLVDESPGRIADDVNHLFRSLKHTQSKAVVDPARCRAYGFEFSEGKVIRPSKNSERQRGGLPGDVLGNSWQQISCVFVRVRPEKRRRFRATSA